MVEQVYRPRRPKASPLWQCLSGHFDAFLELYEEQYQPRYGFLRPIIPEVVNKFLDCGDLERGFARVRCDDCKHEYLLAFSCKGRWCRLPCTVPEGLWCGVRPATRRRSSSSARSCPRRSSFPSRTGILPSVSLKCCALTSALTATCSRTCAAWRTSA